MKKKITAKWIMPHYWYHPITGDKVLIKPRGWIKGKYFYLKDKDLDSDSGQKTGYEHIYKLRFLRYCQNSYAFEVWDNKDVFGI